MKDERFTIAGRGLKLMFFGQLIAIFSFVPSIGNLLSMIGGITILVGLVKIRTATPGYKKAFIMMLLSMAGSVLMAVMAATALGSALSGNGGAAAGSLMLTLVLTAVVSVFGFLQIYFVCTSTSSLLREIGEDATASYGDLCWKLNAATYAVVILVLVVSIFSPGLGGVLNTISQLISLASGTLYIFFLYKSETAFLA